MQIDRIFYPTKTLGYGIRASIWTIGCPHHCWQCSNPELWDVSPQYDITIDTVMACLLPFLSKIDGITITGGDPFFQIEELQELVYRIKKENFVGDVLVYTGYFLTQLEKYGGNYTKALNYIDILIDGPYIEALNTNKGLMGSSNQKIHILNKTFASRYNSAHEWERAVQVIESNNYLFNIGIPRKQCLTIEKE